MLSTQEDAGLWICKVLGIICLIGGEPQDPLGQPWPQDPAFWDAIGQIQQDQTDPNQLDPALALRLGEVLASFGRPDLGVVATQLVPALVVGTTVEAKQFLVDALENKARYIDQLGEGSWDYKTLVQREAPAAHALAQHLNNFTV